MRFFIDEQLDIYAKEIKNYVQELNDFTEEALLDEIIKNTQKTFSDREYVFESDWIEGRKKWRKENDDKIGLIARAIEEKYYVFDDEEEHEWNKKVVDNFIKNMTVINRYTDEEYS